MEESVSKPDIKDVKEALVSLYLNVKVRSTEEISAYNEAKLKEERDSLKDIEPLLLVEYIQSSIEILLNIRNEENALIKVDGGDTDSVASGVSSAKEIPKEYEKQIQLLEEEVRSHVRVNSLC